MEFYKIAIAKTALNALLDVSYVTSYCSVVTSLLRIISGEHLSAAEHHASGHYFIFRFLQHDGCRMT